LTAPTRRQPRAARAPRTSPPGRAPRTRPGPLPTAEVRRRRGPKPPDHVVRALERALAAELGAASVADDAPRLAASANWRTAVKWAAEALARAARRGVTAALAGSGVVRLVREAPNPAMESWFHQTTETVDSDIARAWARTDADASDQTNDAAIMAASTPLAAACGCCDRADAISPRGLVGRALAALRAGAAAIAAAVMREHTRIVAWFARRAGADRYVWTTMKDDRVRDLHRELEATVQHWDRPPLAGLPNFFGHPGEAAGPCRCQAFPISR
jgi:hypothetical protein